MDEKTGGGGWMRRQVGEGGEKTGGGGWMRRQVGEGG